MIWKMKNPNLTMLIMGIIAALAGIFMYVSGSNQVKRDTEPAVAVVTGYEEGEEYDSNTNTTDTVYYPVMSYEVNGETVESRYSVFSYSQDYEIGTSVDIKYDPDNPEEFLVAADSSVQYGAIWVIPVGVIMIVIALVRMRKAAAQNKQWM